VSKKVIIIESNVNSEVANNELIVLWNRSSMENTNFLSLPLYIEEHSEFYKTKFLQWISALSRSKVKNTDLEAYLKINEGLSFFWLTSLGQRNNIIENSQINNVIKLFALEDILKQNQVNEVELISDKTRLIRTIEIFCLHNNLHFTKISSISNKEKFTSIFYIPKFVTSITYLFYFIQIRWPNFKNSELKQEKSSLIFFDMFLNVNNQTDDYKYFNSHYWSILPEMIQKMCIPVTWAHFFYRHKFVPNVKTAERIIQRLNHISKTQNHVIIDSFLSFKIVYSAFLLYTKIYFKTLSIRNKKNLFKLEHITGFNFYHMLKDDFFASCYGFEAMRTSLYYSLIDSYLSNLSFKKTGFYIQENQPWETILINLWKKHNHGVIIGIPHSTVRYWDLRYYYDPSICDYGVLSYLPFPDFIAVNGPAAKHNLIFNRASIMTLKEVEALRYLHLKSQKVSTGSSNKIEKILMCGDFLSATNKKMINCLEETLMLRKEKISISIKPHPGTPIPLSFYNNLDVTIRTDDLSDLIQEFDLIFTSNISSSAVDVYTTGKFLVQYIDWEYFNMSPLRGINGIPYISNGQEFVSVINKGLFNTGDNKQDFFFLDEKLVKWKELIDLYC
jgi:surface carbohydrate biosynthesis protein (TIGR04326 family)